MKSLPEIFAKSPRAKARRVAGNLVAGFVALALILGAAHGLCRAFFVRSAVESLRRQARGIALSAAGRDALAMEELLRTQALCGNGALVVDERMNGVCAPPAADLASAVFFPSGTAEAGDAALAREILSGAEVFGTGRVDLLGGEVVFAAARIADGSGEARAVILYRPMESACAAGEVGRMFAALTCAAALGALCLWAVRRRFTRAIGPDGAEAEEARRREDSVADAAHELRTPLTGIRGMIEPLIDGYVETEAEKQACYRVIYDETIRLQALINDLLHMNRLEAGGAPAALFAVSLPDAARRAQSRMRDHAARAGVELCVDVPDTLPPALGDEERILQALSIFLENAIKFTPEGGRVTIAASESGGRVGLTVLDSGPGIPPEDLPRVWERFFRAGNAQKSGSGLGLAIAKLIVERMGGRVAAQNRPEGGVAFSLMLRRARAGEVRTGEAAHENRAV